MKTTCNKKVFEGTSFLHKVQYGFPVTILLMMKNPSCVETFPTMYLFVL